MVGGTDEHSIGPNSDFEFLSSFGGFFGSPNAPKTRILAKIREIMESACRGRDTGFPGHTVLFLRLWDTSWQDWMAAPHHSS